MTRYEELICEFNESVFLASNTSSEIKKRYYVNLANEYKKEAGNLTIAEASEIVS